MAKLKVAKKKILPSGVYHGKVKKYFQPRGKNYFAMYVELKLDDGTTHEQPIFVNNGWLNSCKFVAYASSIGIAPDEAGEVDLEEFIGNRVQLIIEEATDDEGNSKNEVVEISEYIEV